MKIHHLNCGSLCPLCARLIHGRGFGTESSKLVCHCLLIAHENKLILVDTGFGLSDIQDPHTRLGTGFVKLLKPKLQEEETAFNQIQALGYSPSDVTDIFPTHLDLDHIGGLSDFPQATVHVYKPEIEQILKPTFKDKLRFRSKQFAHNPHWKIYDAINEEWFGLAAISITLSTHFNIKLIPLTGHTKGHVGVAIQKEDGQWLLHCGDAYFHHSQLEDISQMPITLRLFENVVQTHRNQRLKSLRTLKELKANFGDKIEFFCAHDPVEFNYYLSRNNLS